MNKPKIKISLDAYKELLDILNKNPEYTHIKLTHSLKCCRARVDITLDKDEEGLIEDNVDNLKLLYDHNFFLEIKEVIIVFRDYDFKIKVTKSENISSRASKCSSCSGCTKNCTK